MASCPLRDECSPEKHCFKGASFFSLTTPASQLFPDTLRNQSYSINKCDTLIRSMLLRAQYGGMACDVSMLHSYSALWLQRFQSTESLSKDVVRRLPKSKLLDDIVVEEKMYMRDVPRILHEPFRLKSLDLITSEVVGPGRLLKLYETDVCSAGIDFHCSNVVESLLLQESVYTSLCKMLLSNDRDWIADQVKTCIWNYSSGVNRRCILFDMHEENSNTGLALKSVWDEVLKGPFDEFTRKFVRQRLA
jgi:hypothetical protein